MAYLRRAFSGLWAVSSERRVRLLVASLFLAVLLGAWPIGCRRYEIARSPPPPTETERQTESVPPSTPAPPPPPPQPDVKPPPAMESERPPAKEAPPTAAKPSRPPAATERPPAPLGPPSASPSAPATPELQWAEFPWPPPQPSAANTIGRSLFFPGSTRLGQVADELEAALDQTGYSERSYLRAPGGFALVTRLERFRADGSSAPGSERWAVSDERPTLRLSDYLRALVFAPPGHFRVVAFVVSPFPYSYREAPVTSEEAVGWLRVGLNRLPEDVAATPLTDAHRVDALVYEFERDPDRPARILVPGGLSGAQHLGGSGILAALREHHGG